MTAKGFRHFETACTYTAGACFGVAIGQSLRVSSAAMSWAGVVFLALSVLCFGLALIVEDTE